MRCVLYVSMHCVLYIYRCMYAWIYVCMYVCVYGCMCVWMYVCMGVCMYGCMGVWVYGCMGVWVYGCSCYQQQFKGHQGIPCTFPQPAYFRPLQFRGRGILLEAYKRFAEGPSKMVIVCLQRGVAETGIADINVQGQYWDSLERWEGRGE